MLCTLCAFYINEHLQNITHDICGVQYLVTIVKCTYTHKIYKEKALDVSLLVGKISK